MYLRAGKHSGNVTGHEATGLGFESLWGQIKSAVRGSDGICKYLPDLTLYLMLIMRAFVSVCVNKLRHCMAI